MPGRQHVRPAGSQAWGVMGRLVLAFVLAGLAADAPAQSPAASPPGAISVRDVLGTWTGRWTAEDGTSGAVELILTPNPGAPADTLFAQLTFLEGGVSDSARREGRLTPDGVLFQLVGGGTLRLTLQSDRRALSGEFVGGQDFPAPRGSLALTRKS